MLELMSRPTLQLKNNPRLFLRLRLHLLPLPLPPQAALSIMGATMGVWTLARFRILLQRWDSVRELTQLEPETAMAP